VPRESIRTLLAGGTLRSIGRADEVAALVLRQPGKFRNLIECLWDTDPVVRMRAADAAEKATRLDESLLQPYKQELLGLLAEAVQKELRWHLGAMIPRLQLNTPERRRAIATLQTWLADPSSIVKTFAMQGLTDLALQDAENAALRAMITELIRIHTRTGTPAMQARGRKLLAKLDARPD
jgi:hypothetical protein